MWGWGWAGSRWAACWSRPRAGHRGPIVAGPSQARPLRAATAAEFREVSRQGSLRPWPDLLGGAVPQGTGTELVPLVQTDRGGWGGDRAAKQEEQMGTIQTLLAKTALAMSHLGPGEGPVPGSQKTLGSNSYSVAV